MVDEADMAMASVHEISESLHRLFGRPDDAPAIIEGCDPVTPSVHRIGDAAAAALGLLGAQMAAIWKLRTGQDQTVRVTAQNAIIQLMGVFQTTLNGVPANTLFEDPKLFSESDFYRAADGRYVFLLLTYPPLRDIACAVLDCPPSRARYRDAVARWDAFALEEAISAQGGTCFAVRSREEWRAHPQGRLLLDQPVISIEKIGDSAPEPLSDISGPDQLPFSGLRVIDNTHVIAGPVASRIAAEHGAEVVHLSVPAHPDPVAMQVETNIGKRCTYCDLDTHEGQAKFHVLLAGADVYVSSYLSLEQKGFGPRALAARRPGIVVLDYHGWGVKGPWSQRGGFDQLACAATGFSAEEGAFDSPKLPPTYLLNDYLAAILGAAGIAEAIRRRATDGGSYHVHLDLAKVCMWVQDLGLFDRAAVASIALPDPATAAAGLVTVAGPFGETRYLPTQIAYSAMKPALERGAEPLGASPCEWSAQ